MRALGMQGRRRGRRSLWWLLLLLGVAIVVGGYLGVNRYYGDAETKSLASLAFWGMLAGGVVTLNAAGELLQPAMLRGVERLIVVGARRRQHRRSDAQNTNPDRRDTA